MTDEFKLAYLNAEKLASLKHSLSYAFYQRSVEEKNIQDPDYDSIREFDTTGYLNDVGYLTHPAVQSFLEYRTLLNSLNNQVNKVPEFA